MVSLLMKLILGPMRTFLPTISLCQRAGALFTADFSSSDYLQGVSEPSPLYCIFWDTKLLSERGMGRVSSLTFRCKMFNLKDIITSDELSENDSLPSINATTGAISGTFSVDSVFYNLSEIRALLNAPCPANETCAKSQTFSNISSNLRP